MTTRSVAVVTRWIARIWSIFSVALVLVFAVGGVGNSPGPTTHEWIGLLLWPVGVGVGLIVAWYFEQFGGTLALVCLVAVYVWNVVRSGHLPRGPFFVLIAAPGLLFLAAGLLSHRNSDGEQSVA